VYYLRFCKFKQGPDPMHSLDLPLLTHLLLDRPASEPLRRAIVSTTSSNFDHWSRP